MDGSVEINFIKDIKSFVVCPFCEEKTFTFWEKMNGNLLIRCESCCKYITTNIFNKELGII